MSMFWNPVTGSYQKSCPALSPVQKQPLNDSVKGQPLKQPPDDRVDQPPVVELLNLKSGLRLLPEMLLCNLRLQVL